eukprot:GILJ01010194.1.p1 GENE.GILJ01010194.1~~GILJ01010194.1.p1  ORF type:complete len:640 (+),score=99.16 GILJ01010194.1:66-1922(+)
MAEFYDSYSKKFRLNQTQGERQRLLTDRSAYIAFLEVQLERVTASCLTVQGFSERIEQVQSHVNTVEEKISNMTRLLKLLQNYGDQQDDDTKAFKSVFDQTCQEMQQGLTQCQSAVKQLDSSVPSLEHHLKSYVQEKEADWQNKQSLLEKRLENVENVLKLVQDRGVSDDKRLNSALQRNETQLNTSMQDFENRLTLSMSKFKDEQIYRNDAFESRQEALLEKFKQDIKTELAVFQTNCHDDMQKHEKQLNNRLVLLHDKAGQDIQDMTKFEVKMSKWQKLVDSQLRVLNEEIKKKSESADLMQVQVELDQEIRTRQQEIQKALQLASNAEQTCTRLAEDALDRADTYNLRLKELDSRVGDRVKEFTDREKDLKEELHLTTEQMKSMLNKAERYFLTVDAFVKDGDIDPTKLIQIHEKQQVDWEQLEQKLTSKLSEGIARMGDLLKKYVVNQKEMNQRLNDTELRANRLEQVLINKRTEEQVLGSLNAAREHEIPTTKSVKERGSTYFGDTLDKLEDLVNVMGETSPRKVTRPAVTLRRSQSAPPTKPLTKATVKRIESSTLGRPSSSRIPASSNSRCYDRGIDHAPSKLVSSEEKRRKLTKLYQELAKLELDSRGLT